MRGGVKIIMFGDQFGWGTLNIWRGGGGGGGSATDVLGDRFFGGGPSTAQLVEGTWHPETA